MRRIGVATRIDLTLDCASATRLAEFWKLALGYVDEPPPAPFATQQEWLRHHGVPKTSRMTVPGSATEPGRVPGCRSSGFGGEP
jgi:hypothetical protein